MSVHYLDNSATTPLCIAAIDAINNATSIYGNPSSLHSMGLEAEDLVLNARHQILKSLGFKKAKDNQLIFTSCGTEGSNTALIGVALAKERNKGKTIIVGENEHDCVRESANYLESLGYNIVRIPSPNGVWDMEKYKAVLNNNVILVSAMLVNNETGSVNDIYQIFKLAKSVSPTIITHTDAVQGFLKLKNPLSSYGADIITISGHKIGAPKGVGAMYIDEKLITTKSITPIIHGGGQENGMRSGTENTISIAAFGAAAEYYSNSLNDHLNLYSNLNDYLTEQLDSISGVRINKPQTQDYAKNIVNLTVFGIRSETLLHHLSSYNVFVSSGSACASNTGHKSYTLKSFGLSDDDISSSIRVSFGPQNTKEDVDAFVNALKIGLEKLVRTTKR